MLKNLFAVIAILMCCISSRLHATVNYEHCLLKLEHEASEFKRCHVDQLTEEDCRHAKGAYERQVHACESLNFSPGDIEKAISIGEARVNGNPGLSPYQKRLDQQSIVQEVRDSYIAMIKDVLGNRVDEGRVSLLARRFGQGDCTKGILGQNEHFIYMGTVNVEMEPESGKGDVRSDQTTFVFLAKEKEGECYAIDKEAPYIFNVSSEDFGQLFGAGPSHENSTGWFSEPPTHQVFMKVCRDMATCKEAYSGYLSKKLEYNALYKKIAFNKGCIASKGRGFTVNDLNVNIAEPCEVDVAKKELSKEKKNFKTLQAEMFPKELLW